MQTPFRITSAALAVLEALVASGDSVHGFGLKRTVHLPGGTVYPILHRLEDAGWVESHWGADNPVIPGTPRRRLYRLTRTGRASAVAVLRDRQGSDGS